MEFLPLYEGQPVFGDIDAALRALGFAFHRFVNLEGRTLRDSGFADTVETRSQHLFADAVYTRPIGSWGGLPSAQLLKLALMLNCFYNSADFCGYLLRMHDGRDGTDFFRQYTAAF